MVIGPELPTVTCGIAFIPLPTARVRMLVATPRHAPLDGYTLSSVAELPLSGANWRGCGAIEG
jgi:hypothetical protein